jgi:NAD(P)-dependent dehydrogenase (short-subunit alcohol dehydrogenase family)
MDLKLKGKRALVTGSSSGLGEAVAKKLAEEGVEVIVHGRDAARANAVVKQIESAGGKAKAAVGDLSTDKGADDVIKVAGDVDILINNAGGFDSGGPPIGSYADVVSEHWTRSLEANLISGGRMIHRLVPGMQKRGWGRVIHISSNLGVVPSGFHLAYESSKAATIAVACGLAKALRGSGVTANTVSPGAMRTPAFEKFIHGLAKQMGWSGSYAELEEKYTTQMAPEMTGRIADPGDIASVIAFIASPLAKEVNGANIRADGGLVPSV